MTMVPVTIMCMHVDCCLVLHKNASCYLTCIVSMTLVLVTIMFMHVDCCLVLHKNASCYLTCTSLIFPYNKYSNYLLFVVPLIFCYYS